MKLLANFLEALEKETKVNNFVVDYIVGISYLSHKKVSNHGGSLKNIPGWIKKRDNNPWKYNDKNFQYPATVELNYKKLK